MALRNILSIPNPVLYEISLEVNQFDSSLRQLSLDLFETMYAAGGVGLAAVQVGVLQRMMVIDLQQNSFQKEVFINPEVISMSKEIQDGPEGCLSVPGFSVPLKRPKSITVKYKNLFNEEKTIDAEDLFARAILHEMDHMDGKIFVDLLEPHIYKTIEEDLHNFKEGRPLNKSIEPPYRKQKLKPMTS